MVGCGKKGFKDGSFEEASFNNPQGTVFHSSNYIYVADTQNHSIRQVKFSNLEN